MNIITIEKKVLEKNEQVANENREYFKNKNIFCLNLVSSPGSGKTSLLEKTFGYFKDKTPIAVIEGDVQTNLDAERVAKFGVPVVQIVTNGACHLEAKLVQDAMSNLNLSKVKLLFIENVGNLVCPASYDLGENAKIVILSVTEGDDKPLKYPKMFMNASVLVINKTDLLPYLKCNIDDIISNALKINPSLKIFKTSCITNEGIDLWCSWLEEKISVNK